MQPEFVFSSRTLAGYCIAGTVYLILPAAAFLLLKKYRAARLYPVITGAVCYFLAVQCSNLCAHFIGFSMSFSQKTVIAAELVCYFEETARWLAMRYPVTDIRKTNAALCYGIGHGGLECIIRGVQKFRIFRYGQRWNTLGPEGFVSGDAGNAADILAQMQEYGTQTLIVSLLDSLQAVTNFGFHLALSLLIFRKMNESNYAKRWLLLAILLHICMNTAGWLASFSGSKILCGMVGILTGISLTAVVFRFISLRGCVNEILYPIKDSE